MQSSENWGHFLGLSGALAPTGSLSLPGPCFAFIHISSQKAKVVATFLWTYLKFNFSCVNPILYAFLSDNFRKAFYNLMPCFMKLSGGPTHPGDHALRYELTTMKSSTRGRRSLRDIRRRKKPKKKENGTHVQSKNYNGAE